MIFETLYIRKFNSLIYIDYDSWRLMKVFILYLCLYQFVLCFMQISKVLQKFKIMKKKLGNQEFQD